MRPPGVTVAPPANAEEWAVAVRISDFRPGFLFRDQREQKSWVRWSHRAIKNRSICFYTQLLLWLRWLLRKAVVQVDLNAQLLGPVTAGSVHARASSDLAFVGERLG